MVRCVFLSPASVASSSAHLRRTSSTVETDLYGGRNSFINSVALNESSFGHRDKFLTFQLYASSPTYGNPYPTQDGIPFVQG